MVVINNFEKDLWEGLEHEKSVETPEIHKDGKGANKRKLHINWKVIMPSMIIAIYIFVSLGAFMFSLDRDLRTPFVEADCYLEPAPGHSGLWQEGTMTIYYNRDRVRTVRIGQADGTVKEKTYKDHVSEGTMDLLELMFVKNMIKDTSTPDRQDAHIIHWKVYYDGQCVFEHWGLGDSDYDRSCADYIMDMLDPTGNIHREGYDELWKR